MVNAGSSTTTQVNLSPAYNRMGIVTDGTTFSSSGGIDFSGSAYSANLLGTTFNFQGVTFNFGPAGSPDSVSNTTVALPAGQFSTLAMLGTAVNGSQQSQSFKVTYADGTSSTFTQSLSDWSAPQNFAGESKALAMAYRDRSNGTKDTRTFNLYGYSFALNPAKTVSSITLPNNNNVVLVAMTLTGASPSPDFTISASPSSQTVTVGGGTSYTATLGALNGFTGTVTLTASGLPTGATATFSPATVAGSGTSTASITTTSSTPAGTYTITFLGTSGSLQHSASAKLVVNAAPDFTISASPSSQTVTVGGGTSYTATLGALNGFTGTVTLTAGGLPTGATATFSPATVAGSGTSTANVTTTSSTPAGTYTITFTGTSGSLQHSASAKLVVNAAPDFTISASPSSQTVTVGGGTSYTATLGALNGFTGTVTLTAGGLPTGATATFSPATVAGSGTSTANVTTTSSTPAGTYTITFTGTSGSLQHSASATLVVNAGSSTTTQVNLSPAYNRMGIVTDGTTFSSSGGIDFSGSAYSANLLGTTFNFEGVTFNFGPAGSPDSVSNTTVALPAGQFSTLAMLGTAVNGSQQSQSFKVTYADGTSSTFTQSLSDWFTPQNFAGESKALAMVYRDRSNGTKDTRTFNLYGYSFALNPAKTVSSITLPNINNVVVLAVTLMP